MCAEPVCGGNLLSFALVGGFAPILKTLDCEQVRPLWLRSVPFLLIRNHRFNTTQGVPNRCTAPLPSFVLTDSVQISAPLRRIVERLFPLFGLLQIRETTQNRLFSAGLQCCVCLFRNQRNSEKMRKIPQARSVPFTNQRGRPVASCHKSTIGSVVPNFAAVCRCRITVKIGGSNRKAESGHFAPTLKPLDCSPVCGLRRRLS